MKRTQALSLALSLLACLLAAAGWWDSRRRPRPLAAEEPSRQEGWLRGSTDERFEQVEKQLRGLDKSMVEVGYRFVELYFAGKDGNWPYADYQAEKIETAIRLGVERRPKRAASARYFLDEDLPAMRAALKKRNEAEFDRAVKSLRQACMRCHIREDVPHFMVQIPERRLSPIRRRTEK